MRCWLWVWLSVGVLACAPAEPEGGEAPEVQPLPADGAEGAPCGAEARCDAALQCVSGLCVVPCAGAQDCASGVCHPLPGLSWGWCAFGDAPEDQAAPGERPRPPMEEGAPPSPPVDPWGEPQDPPPGDDGAEPPADERPPAPEVPQDPPPDPAPPTDDGPAEPDPQADPPSDPAPPATPPPAEPCDYPAAGRDIQVGQVMPRLSWRGVYGGDGQTVDFDLRDFHCEPQWARYEMAFVIVGAEWCGACSQYLAELAGEAAAIDAAGGLLLFIETEDNNNQPASHRVAQRVVDRHLRGAPGLRIGDGETEQGARAVYNSSIVQSFPTVFAFRRSDLRVFASNLAAQQLRGLLGQGGGGGECSEEAAEPNDSVAQAGAIGAQWVEGGVCDGGRDYWRIDHAGAWTLELLFSHGDGDLDVYLWDEARDQPRSSGGRPIGSDSGDDDEGFEGSGPGTVVVLGYQGARAPYRLRVTPR